MCCGSEDDDGWQSSNIVAGNSKRNLLPEVHGLWNFTANNAVYVILGSMVFLKTYVCVRAK